MPDYPRPPTLSPSDPAYQQKFQAYNAAIREYQKQYRAAQGRIDKWRGTQPWYVREWEVIPVGLSFAGGLWILLSALRAVGAPRRSTPLERPPTCDACGYNLTTMPVDSRCPECGEPVAASLGPDVRPGSPWRHRRTRGRWEAWKRCAAGAVLHTRAFARQLPLTRAGADHRSFLAVQLPVVFIIGVLALYGLHALKTPAGRFPESWAVILALTSAFGMGCVAGTVGVTVGAATLVGFIQSFKAGRNLLPGAIQVACYLAPYLMFWAMFGAVTALTVLKLEETGIFRAAQELTRFHRDILAFMTWLIPNLAWALWHTVLVARGTVAMRYANR